jgi:TolB-like protein/class 3 adenylate cyclase/Flp pilus assembly protein TadD
MDVYHDELEIAHVLFIDIVGYSKRSIEEQSQLITQLGDLVRLTGPFSAAEAARKLISIPTGDGMALAFFTTPDAPLRCAIELSKACRSDRKIELRMGIHSGPVNRLADVNQQNNIAGAGINFAQRVMDCGDAGHILMSKRAADDLMPYQQWQPHLHELGEFEVKHGIRIPVVSFYNGEAGNAAIPDKLARAKHAQVKARIGYTAAVALLLIFAFTTFNWWRHRHETLGREGKSIAVLPFENLSADPENAFFADGMQDEILTDLGRIADLKVISRTSVMRYKAGAARDVRAIAQALGVAHLLEGSVQRAGGKVRVNAQLIDGRTDTHVWAQSYDRNLADVFSIQTEIARAIADQLQARLSTREKSELERAPTSNDEAFALYTQARTVLVSASSADPEKDTFLHAADLLTHAIALDPDFLLAYCELVHAHAELYFYNFDHTDARRALAESALQNAIRLRPDAGETHLAHAEFLYRCLAKYDRSRAELALAARSLPNNSRIYALTGFIDRRQGNWEEAIRNLEKAVELDPQNLLSLQQIAAGYPFLRRFDDEASALDRLLVLNPKDPGLRVSRAFVELERHANLEPYREAVRQILEKNPELAEDIASEWFAVSWYDRNGAEATRATAAIPASGGGTNAIRYPKAWYEGLAARLRQDAGAAQEAFRRARVEAEKAVQERPEYGPPLSVLGLIDAMLGRRDEASKEAERATELLSVAQDSINGSSLLLNLAIVHAALGEKALAITEIQKLVSKPGDGSYGDFRLNPFWDPLRGDPGFEKIVSSMAPGG